MICEFRPIYLKENKGLGNALRVAVENSTYNLIARMDSDDISYHRRFELQLNKFIENPELDIVGGNITEFVGEPEQITGQRIVPTTDVEIKADMKKRCAMNHVSVMYKKSTIQKVGGYIDWFCNEDYYLWIRMLEDDCNFCNVKETLVNVRTGEAMSGRRGGWNYFKSEEGLQHYMLDKQIISFPRYLYNVAIRFGGEVVATNYVRRHLFKLVRKKYVQNSDFNNEKYDYNLENIKDYPPFSVAMSVYKNDNPEWLDVALESIINQTVKPNEIVLVVDGPISDELNSVIKKYEHICCLGKRERINNEIFVV